MGMKHLTKLFAALALLTPLGFLNVKVDPHGKQVDMPLLIAIAPLAPASSTRPMIYKAAPNRIGKAQYKKTK